MDFYYSLASAPCRAVLMTAKAVGVKLNHKEINLMAGEHMTPVFLKLNPQHTLPTLVDNGMSLCESRPIQMYLAEKYGKDDSLYPKDPRKRVIVNQRLFFDVGTLYQRFGDYWFPQIYAKAPANPENKKKMEEAVGFLDRFLEGSKYAAGDKLTIADISLSASIANFEAANFDFSKYPNVTRLFLDTVST